MVVFTEKQLVSFGNYLLKRYGVQVYSTDGTNTPLYPREVHDADFRNWHETPEGYARGVLPSAHQIGDTIAISFAHATPSMSALVRAVHFFESKVKYDLQLDLGDSDTTRIYNVDSYFCQPNPPTPSLVPDPSAVFWNKYNKVVQDHRDGTIDHERTNEERSKRGLPTPWTPEMGEVEHREPPIE